MELKTIALAAAFAVVGSSPVLAQDIVLASVSSSDEVEILPAGPSPWCAQNGNDGCYQTMFIESGPILASASAKSSKNFAAENGYGDLEQVHVAAMTPYFFKD